MVQWAQFSQGSMDKLVIHLKWQNERLQSMKRSWTEQGLKILQYNRLTLDNQALPSPLQMLISKGSLDF